MKDFKKLVSTVLMFATVLAFSGCSGAKEKASDSASSIKIKAGVLKTADSFPLYVAEEEGLFEKYGVDMEIIEFGSASNQSTAYEAGEINMMMTDMVVLSLINKNATDNRLRVVANSLGSTVEEGRFLIVSGPNSSITTPEQLEGAKIGISENTMMQYLTLSYLRNLGVDESKVELVNVPNLSLRLDSVIEGADIQAAILPDPLAMEAVAKGCNTVIDDTKLDTNYSVTVIAADDRVTADEQTTKNFLAAYNEAIEMIDADPSKYNELFSQKISVPPEVADLYTVPTYTKDCLPTEENVASIQDWLVETGLSDKAAAYDEVVCKVN